MDLRHRLFRSVLCASFRCGWQSGGLRTAACKTSTTHVCVFNISRTVVMVQAVEDSGANRRKGDRGNRPEDEEGISLHVRASKDSLSMADA